MERRFECLERKLLANRPGAETAALRSAFEYAAARHAGQRRKTGEPYLTHPLEVAHILADMRLDEATLVGALLHDTVEDTSATVNEIRRRFGPDVARCVDGVTKIGRLDYQSKETRQAETFRKMVLAMARDVRVILVKLADRLHNMRTLGALDAERQRGISLETLEIYAPVALRLGMGKLRGELEDLAFSYLKPNAYRRVRRELEARREASEGFLRRIQSQLQAKLDATGIRSRLEGRIKRPYSIYQKLERQKVTFDMVYDLLALRVITGTKKDCYAALGVIHDQWQPVPGRFKDFVAMSRPNGYRSLHTSVVTGDGQRFEIQIRTEEMHREAEQGICAHWIYKQDGGLAVSRGQREWLSNLVRLRRELRDSTEFLSTFKKDLYPEEVYVFTPKGKVIALPRRATPVDFAYAIHTEVGHTCKGAKVDGRIVPLRKHLRSGDIVEVLTHAGSRPSQDWLGFVKTSRARNKIKQWLNAERRREAVEIGRSLLEKEARRASLSLRRVQAARFEEVCREYGCSSPEDLYARLGFGRFSVRQVVRKLLPESAVPDGDRLRSQPPAIEPPAAGAAASTAAVLRVPGVDGVLIRRAKCCNPILGDPVVGYVTRGKGVAVHRTGCRNVQNLMFEADRRIDVVWGPGEGSQYQARLTAFVDDRKGVLAELTAILTGEGINIVRVHTRAVKSAGARVELVVEVSGKRELEKVRSKLAGAGPVRAVIRSGPL